MLHFKYQALFTYYCNDYSKVRGKSKLMFTRNNYPFLPNRIAAPLLLQVYMLDINDPHKFPNQ